MTKNLLKQVMIKSPEKKQKKNQMKSLNKVLLIGNMGRAAEPFKTPNAEGCKFSLATTEKYKDQEETTWHNCVAWGKVAEIIQKYTTKGSPIYLEGKISNRTRLL